jgi:hypothetical protein
MGKFLRKSLMNGIVIIPLVLWFTEATFFASLITALALSTIAYLIGDQVILRMSNNMVATLADAGLAFAFLWVVAIYTGWSLTVGEMFIIVALLSVVEWIFHRQLGRMDRSRI